MPSQVSEVKARSLTARALSALLAPITGLWAFVEAYAMKNVGRLNSTRLKNLAFLDNGLFEGVIGKILTLIIVFAILGGTAVTFFTNLKSLVVAFNNTSGTGNTTVDGFLAIFGLIVAVLGVFALVKLVQNSAKGG